jgi:two-component system, NtrC family, response regulator HydG
MLGVESDAALAANTPSTMPPPPDEPKDFLANVLAERLPFTEARQCVVAEFERRYVEDLLARHNGNVTHAARASGIAHRYFQLVRARSLK